MNPLTAVRARARKLKLREQESILAVLDYLEKLGYRVSGGGNQWRVELPDNTEVTIRNLNQAEALIR